MLSIILIYFIGKYFHQLASKYLQNKWLYAILGVLSYYIGSIVIGGLIVGLFMEFLMNSSIDNYSNRSFGLMLMPFGIGSACLFHYLLERKWKKSVVLIKDEIDDIGKNEAVDN